MIFHTIEHISIIKLFLSQSTSFTFDCSPHPSGVRGEGGLSEGLHDDYLSAGVKTQQFFLGRCSLVLFCFDLVLLILGCGFFKVCLFRTKYVLKPN